MEVATKGVLLTLDGEILVERVRLDGRGRAPIPSTIRRQLQLKEGDNLIWLVDRENASLRLIKEERVATLLASSLEKRDRPMR